MNEQTTSRVVEPPFLIVNPKAYLGSADTLELATITDELAARFGIDVIFTANTSTSGWSKTTPNT